MGWTISWPGTNPAFNGVMLEKAAADAADTLGARLDRVRKLFYYVKYDARLEALSRHPAVLAVARTLLGGREPALFQDMALLKPPRIGREKPWHQDHAYFDLPLDEPVVGRLDRARLGDGRERLHAVPGRRPSRRAAAALDAPRLADLRHQMLGRESVACPLPAGGAVFFDSLVPHGTPQNSSPIGAALSSSTTSRRTPGPYPRRSGCASSAAKART